MLLPAFAFLLATAAAEQHCWSYSNLKPETRTIIDDNRNYDTSFSPEHKRDCGNDWFHSAVCITLTMADGSIMKGCQNDDGFVGELSQDCPKNNGYAKVQVPHMDGLIVAVDCCHDDYCNESDDRGIDWPAPTQAPTVPPCSTVTVAETTPSVTIPTRVCRSGAAVDPKIRKMFADIGIQVANTIHFASKQCASASDTCVQMTIGRSAFKGCSSDSFFANFPSSCTDLGNNQCRYGIVQGLSNDINATTCCCNTNNCNDLSPQVCFSQIKLDSFHQAVTQLGNEAAKKKICLFESDQCIQMTDGPENVIQGCSSDDYISGSSDRCVEEGGHVSVPAAKGSGTMFDMLCCNGQLCNNEKQN